VEYQIDTEMLDQVTKTLEGNRNLLIEEVDQDYGVFEDAH